MNDTQGKRTAKHKAHNRWLILIALFKLAQALLFVAIAVGALRLVHKDVGDELESLANHLRFNTEPRFINFILEKASFIDDRMLRRISAGFFLYAGLDMVEAVGLYLEKAWAEYFTLVITASFLPWEIYEIIRKITWARVSLLTINALVLAYLARLIWERQQSKKARKH
jgi:uncharacterized membrane protein (DUF2068 family)